MKEFIPVLVKSQLFSGVGHHDIEAMIGCLKAVLSIYRKGQYVFHQGHMLSDISVVVKGQLHMQRVDYWGNSNIIGALGVGEMFGEGHVTPHSGPLLNDVIAAEHSAVLFFDARRIITTCSSACPFHVRVVQNLFYAMADKNRKLMQKLGHMSHRSTREKLKSYLSEESHRQGSASFQIPFNRQQLADFLSVDRSALSKELCKMRDQGIIEFRKNDFTLL